jgi:hypothetical protein
MVRDVAKAVRKNGVASLACRGVPLDEAEYVKAPE